MFVSFSHGRYTRQRLTSCPAAQRKREREKERSEGLGVGGERVEEKEKHEGTKSDGQIDRKIRKNENEHGVMETHARSHTQLWLYILATTLFCRREQSLLCVAESFTYGAFQTLL